MQEKSAELRAFAHWIRTGQRPMAAPVDNVERKFNPYHDPRDGRFTFGPGGARSLSGAGAAGRRRAARETGSASVPITPFAAFLRGKASSGGRFDDGVFRPDGTTRLRTVQYRPPPRIGSNSGAFQDPLILEQAFPRLREAPGGAIVALADNVFDFTGPGRGH